ncbi:MAG: hypothetical protein KIS92_10380 [Planctomycetota bacterium]|nr:hypothetical protein [Planctomycetota bacterium]
MMRKLFGMMAAGVLAVGLVGCGGGDKKPAEPTKPTDKTVEEKKSEVEKKVEEGAKKVEEGAKKVEEAVKSVEEKK